MNQFEEYEIIDVICETSDVKTLRFVDANHSHPEFTAGQYVSVCFPDLGVPEGKCYSLSSAPHDPFFAITVKNVGPYSQRLTSLRKGEKILVSKPYGFLNPEFDDKAPIVCIAAGVGVSPLFSIVRDALRKNPDRQIDFYITNKTPADVVFANDLDRMAHEFVNVKLHHYITRDPTADDRFFQSRINLSQIFRNSKFTPETFYFVCGTTEFVGDMWRGLVENDIDEMQIATETFF